MKLLLTVVAILLSITASGTLYAEEEKPTELVVLKSVQGGFAGFTGTQITINTDGSWKQEQVFNQKLTLKRQGQLNDANLTKLREVLKRDQLLKLPKTLGKPIGANPKVMTLSQGDQVQCVWTQSPGAQFPDAGPNGNKPTDRFVRITQTILKMTAQAKQAE